MLTLSQKLTRAYLDLHQSDAQELVTAAKTILSDFLSERDKDYEDRENQTIADARDSAMSVIQEEAEARIWLGDDDPEHERNTLLNDVVAIAFQYFN